MTAPEPGAVECGMQFNFGQGVWGERRCTLPKGHIEHRSEEPSGMGLSSVGLTHFFNTVETYDDGCQKSTWLNFHENGHQHVCVCGKYDPHDQATTARLRAALLAAADALMGEQMYQAAAAQAAREEAK